MNHSGNANKMVSDTPRTDAAYAASTGAGIYELFKESQDIERELNAANDRIKSLIEERDRANRLAEWKWNLRDEFQLLLGTDKIEEGIEAVKELKRRIKRLEEAGVWQPIETAPTDMTWVIGYDAKDGEVGTIIFDLTGDVDDEDVHYEWTDGMRTWNPTHWMPLPEPPEAKEAKP